MSALRLSLLGVLLAALASQSAAQDDLIKLPGLGGKARSFADVATVKAEIVPAEAKPGQEVTFKLTVIPKQGAHTYPIDPPGEQPSRNDVAWPKKGDLIFLDKVEDPAGAEAKMEDGMLVHKYTFPFQPTWELKAVVNPNATPGEKTVILVGTSLLACTDAGQCFNSPRDQPPSATIKVLPGPPLKVPERFVAAVNRANAGAAPSAPVAVAAGSDIPPSLKSDATREGSARTGSDFLGLLAAAVFWGFVSLITPCVFPMIPITVSLFLKHSNQSAGGAVKLALVYSLTIIAVLGTSAVFLLSVFRELSVNPYMNIFLGGLFVVFALSLFGMYDITLPGFMLRYTEKRRGAGGLVGTVFGALAFSIVSFTCVAPFLGGFAGMASTGGYSKFELIVAGIVFATAFASPFFVLALFPSLLKKLPKSGGWLDTIKAVMGFLELAAAVKFFRNAELSFLGNPLYLTFDVALTAMIVTAGACGLYLLNLFRLPHDEEKPSIGVPRLVFALAFIGLALYLTPALFRGPDGRRQQPRGVVYAWVDAFLLNDPEPSCAGGASGAPDSTELPWSIDREAEIKRIVGELKTWEQARAANPSAPLPPKRLVFIDFTGKFCQNCQLNEDHVFPLPEVESLLRQYTLVQQYTDEVPIDKYNSAPDRDTRHADALKNLQYQRQFGTEQLPLYVILEPQANGEVKTLGVYDEGKINDVSAFVEFLRKPLEAK